MLPPALDRKIHDAWTAICHTLRWRITETKGENLPHSTLHEGKQSTINNQWEHAFDRQLPAVESVTNYPCRLFTLDNVLLSGDRAHVFLDSKTLLAADTELPFENKKKIRRPIKWLAQTIEEPLFHLSGPNHENHGHFITQFLPRVLACLDLLRKNPEIRILVAPTHKRWQAKYLTYFGIPPERIIEGTAGTLLCRRLYYCPLFHGSNDLVQPELYTQLQSLFINGIQQEKQLTQKPVIFLSRSDAPDRKLANEQALLAIIEKTLGSVNVIHLAKFSLDEQIKLLNQAEWIIAPQGQGLTTSLFANKANVVILESQQPPPGHRDWATSFRDLAIYAGNHAVRLYVGTHNPNKGDWDFPEKRFQDDLNKLLSCASNLTSAKNEDTTE